MFAAGLAFYRQTRLDQAAQAFQQVLAHWPGYAPGLEFLRRCQAGQAESPPPEWDAVFRPDKK